MSKATTKSLNKPAAGEASDPNVAAGEDDTPISIGDLAAEFGITTRAIRFYEARGLLSPLRRGTNRSFTRRDRARLRLILRGKNLGFTLEDIGEYLSLYDTDPTQVTQTKLLLEKVEATIADLNAKRADLDRTLEDLKEIRAQCRRHLAR
jgi:DNA-binding transcriptional MerR regulator